MAGDVSDEEQAWQDLIARLTEPAPASEEAPWPERESLPARPAGRERSRPPGRPSATPAQDADGQPRAAQPNSTSPAAPPDPADRPAPEPGWLSGPTRRWLAPDADSPRWDDPPVSPHARVVRPAASGPADHGEDHFVPPPPPPLPRLDPVSKGAWAALFGGPGYLLLAVMLSWEIPGWAAFCAVGAFVAGFAVLVVRLGDGPPRDSGSDDGAVV